MYPIWGKGGEVAEMGVDFREKKHALCAVCNLGVPICIYFCPRKVSISQNPPSRAWAVKASQVH